jgi:hypothetical protein
MLDTASTCIRHQINSNGGIFSGSYPVQTKASIIAVLYFSPYENKTLSTKDVVPDKAIES